MKRFTTETRSDWEKKVEEVGLLFHHTKEGLYWDESAYYELTSGEVDELERATNELQKLCLDAVQHVIDTNQFDRLAIPPGHHRLLFRTANSNLWARGDTQFFKDFVAVTADGA
ncbi:MAG: glutathionylspermidine synthase family protein, partial [Syntrophobacteraceae bacterium]|nr:glutathionylspermidine synthase family protein [Syntrophobacteraceae bacterium]